MNVYTARRLALVGLMAASMAGGIAIAESTNASSPALPPAATPGPLVPPAPQPLPEVSSVTLEPCKAEDGPGPCVWNADARGNGVGYSFWIDDEQCTHYFSAKAQRKMDPIVNGSNCR